MNEEAIHFGKLLLKQSETITTHLTLVTFDPVTSFINQYKYRHSSINIGNTNYSPIT